MSDTKFTPGPWSIDRAARDYAAPGAPILGTIRGAGEKPDGGEHISLIVGDLQHESEANASLIAAAPRMYEALALLVRNIRDGKHLRPTSPQLRIATEALLSARGETS